MVRELELRQARSSGCSHLPHGVRGSSIYRSWAVRI